MYVRTYERRENSFTNLQFLGTRSRADGQSERVIELMHDEIQVHGFLPIDVGIADRQFLAVLTKDVDLGLEFGQISRRRLHVLLANEEEQIVTVDGVLRLKEEVSHEKIRPVRRALEYDESGIWKNVGKRIPAIIW